MQFPGLRPLRFLSSLTGLGSGLGSSSQDLRPGLLSVVPAGLRSACLSSPGLRLLGCVLA
jgi:hypothetical protein